MKKIIFFTLVPLAVLTGIALCVPIFVSLEGIKPRIQKEFHKNTGYQINLKGDINFALLPFPKVTLNDVEVLSAPSDPSGLSLVCAEASKLSAQLSFWELFRGHLVVHKIRAIHPTIYTDRWDSFSNTKQIKSSPSQSPRFDTISSASSSVIQIHEIDISRGEVIFSSTDKISDLAFKLYPSMSSGSLTGLTFTGTCNYDKSSFSIDGKMTQSSQGFDVTSAFTLFGQKGHFEGALILSPFTLTGSVKSSGNLGQLFLETLSFDEEKDTVSYTLTGELALTPEQFDLSKISVIASPYTLLGSGSYVFGSHVASLRIDASDDRHKGSALNLTVSSTLSKGLKGYPPFKVSLSGTNIEPYLMKSSSAASFLGKSVMMEGVIKTTPSGVVADNFSLKLGDLELQGSLSYTLSSPGPKLTYDLTIPKLNPLGLIFGISNLEEIFGLSAHIKGQSSLGSPKIKTLTTVTGPLLCIQMDGLFNLFPWEIDGTIQVRAQSSNSVLSRYLGKSAFEIITAKGSSKRLDLIFSPSKTSSSGKALSGSLFASFGTKKTQIGGTLLFNEINLSPTETSPSPRRSFSSPSKGRKEHHSQPDKSDSDLSFLKCFDIDVLVKINQLIWEALQIDHVEAQFKTQNNSLALAPFHGILFGGTLEGRASLSYVTSPLLLEASATLTGAHVRHLKIRNNNFSLEQGALHSSTKFTAHGPTLSDFLNSVTGVFSLQVQNGVVNGFDLDQAVKSIRAADTLGGILGLLDASFSKGRSHFRTLNLEVLFENGQGRLQDSHLLANSATILAQGTLRLDPAQCHITGDINLHIPNIPSIGYIVSGPLGDPSTSLNTDKLESYITSQILPSIFGSLGKDGQKVARALTSLVPTGTPKKSSKSPQEKSGGNPLNNLVQNGLDFLGL